MTLLSRFVNLETIEANSFFDLVFASLMDRANISRDQQQ